MPVMRMLRFPAVLDGTGLSRSTAWRLERRGEFPRHRHVSANAVGGREDEIAEWSESRASFTLKPQIGSETRNSHQ